MERLAAGELVYTGVLRTNPCAITSHVPVRGAMCPVSAESFAIMADTYLLLGTVTPADYTCPTPDGRPNTAEFACERLARLVCSDGEMLDEAEILMMARYLYDQQVNQISHSLHLVLSRFHGACIGPAVATGLGRSLAVEAARRLGLAVADLAPDWDTGLANVTPSLAVAFLLARRLEANWQT